MTGLPGWAVPPDGLVPYDPNPLARRTPLVLIHGIAPEKGEAFNWGHFLQFVEGDPAFQGRFKIYLFHYNPADPLEASVERLRHDLRHLIQTDPRQTHPRSFRVLASSQGGLLLRKACEDPNIRQAVEKGITLGTPFHGTPIASPVWIKARTGALSPFRAALNLTYGVVRRKFPFFDRDFCWDNVDEGFLTGERAHLCRTVDRPGWGTDRFILYASFFGADPGETGYLLGRLGLDPAFGVRGKSLPLFSRATVFGFTRWRIARLPLANARSAQNLRSPPLMRYSDGVTPIASSLWLGRFLEGDNGPLNRQAELWQALENLKGRGRARLFAGLDHQDWLLGQTRSGEEKIADLLHPDELPKSPFEWVIHDLMRD